MSSPAVRQALHLLTPMGGTRIFVAGEDGCTRIEHLPGGAGYEVYAGSKMLKVPEHRVDHFEQDPRPGYEQELANASRPMPDFAEPNGDGTYKCLECGKSSPSLHALKVHHGRAHGEQR